MSETPLPAAVAVRAHVPGYDYAKGDIIADAGVIAAIYEGQLQRSVVAVHVDYAKAHVAKPDAASDAPKEH